MGALQHLELKVSQLNNYFVMHLNSEHVDETTTLKFFLNVLDLVRYSYFQWVLTWNACAALLHPLQTSRVTLT